MEAMFHGTQPSDGLFAREFLRKSLDQLRRDQDFDITEWKKLVLTGSFETIHSMSPVGG